MRYYKPIILISLSITILTCSFFSDSDKDKERPVEHILEIVSIDSLQYFVNVLSGEAPFIIDDQEELILSRHSDHIGNDLAADFLWKKLASYDVAVTSQWSGTVRNIIGTQTGKDHPGQVYIIGAHYDCMPDSSVSPGADDNASGVAAVLEAARILSQYETAYTVIYALWDEEEQGVHGSGYYASLANDSNMNIAGVINIDMIGWDSDDDRTILINTRTEPNSIPLSDKALAVVEDYSLDLVPMLVLPGSGSDNLPFWYFGFSAIGIEEHYGVDWNDYYHTTGDRLDKFNIPYFHESAKLAIGTLAELVEIQE
jgi:Zn-dependent M28 family amino/carboxypeptidase